MADWRQIQARIRKAKNAQDPFAKLSELYQRTRDGMVAWELGVVEEKNGRSDEAVKWYKLAAEKFRRADWKKKAEEALTRLGAEPPKENTPEDEIESPKAAMDAMESPAQAANVREPLAPAVGEVVEEDEVEEQVQAETAVSGAAAGANAANGAQRKRRRGRRGGRGRRRKNGPAAAPGLPAQAFAATSTSGSEAATPRPPQAMAAAASVSERVPHEMPAPPREPRESRPSRSEIVYSAPQLPSERAAHGRSDPALSSRMAHLESLLRRLMSSPLHRLSEADEAPAGPGVFLLSEADQSSSYYIEACQTLRVGVGNLVRGQRSQKSNRGRGFSENNLKERLAEYLGINEAKVSQYLKDHCVVRWIQLDDESSNLAHFAIGILRTPLNAE